jgi:uncharacterized repeat protein (TIGR03803 family)
MFLAKLSPTIEEVTTALVGVIFAVSMIFTPATAQTFRVLHNFTPQAYYPMDGLTMDAAGNLYGSTTGGGSQSGQCRAYGGCGTVFRVSFRNSQWLYAPIYEFQWGSDGAGPYAAPIVGPDGRLYGTTIEGGGSPECTANLGCGTVYRLSPPSSFCPSAICLWHDEVIHAFEPQGNLDGSMPKSRVTFDAAGNLYGTTYAGGTNLFGPNFGTVYELTPTQAGWNEAVLWTFLGGYLFGDIGAPDSAVILDSAGNIYGTGEGSECGIFEGCGAVYQLSLAQGQWHYQLIHHFSQPGDGINPAGSPIWDTAGNMYGSTFENSLDGMTGPGIWKLSPSNGSWTETVLYNWPLGAPGGRGSLTMDAQGSLYGVQSIFGQGLGSVFKLTNSNGVWTYSTLHEFSGLDGAYPNGSLVIDRDGNIFGTTTEGGPAVPRCSSGCGVIFEISQH